jgi:peptidoglycan/xylan/chitin deacetylase (PgdA/CDA1 family)
MSLSRRSFIAAAAAGLAACSKTAHRVVGSTSTSAPAPSAAPPKATTTTQHSGPAQLVYNGPRDRKMVAFTFHGSGLLTLTEQMLDVTKRLSAPITVFAVGTWLQQNPSITHRILDAGHELENHTFTHPQLRGASAATIGRECVGCRDVLKAQTGSGGTYFRPSGMEGNYPPAVMDEAGLAGYPVVVGFDVDPSDYLDPGAAAIEARVRQNLKPGSIVSLHLGHAGTVAAFPTLVSDARAKGLEPVLVRDLLA